MLVSNDINDSRNGWIGVDIHQTLVFSNVTLYLATGLALPCVPRIGEDVEVYGSIFSGNVTKVTYQAHCNTYNRDNPDKPIIRVKDLPPFNYCTIKIDLAKAVHDDSISSYEIKEAFIDICDLIRASKKEIPTDFKERMKLKGDMDYERHLLRYVYDENDRGFDGDKFDELFPAL